MTFVSWNSAATLSTTTTMDSSTEVAFAVSNSCQGSSGADELAVLHLMLSRQSSRFKGVVPQPNGRWGAQIYDRHARVWLGTYPDEEIAARAYDVAAVRFRGREATTNFPEERASAGELAFLAAHSKSEIVDMLRKHTYAAELRQGLRRGRGMGTRAQPTPSWARKPLFEKVVTPSDVGKLNRLVVPKQQAEKHFPLKRAAMETSTGRGVLNFEDGEGKVWRFRYSYWNSSQSYVLTNGWSRFVREKGLRASDTVAFSQSVYGQDNQLVIDCRKTPKKQDQGTAAISDAVETRAIKLFGVDIAGGGHMARVLQITHEND